MKASQSPNTSAAQIGTCNFSSDAVKILEEEPDARYEITSDDVPRSRVMCTVTYVVRGNRYTGSSPGIDLAKAKAARLALKHLYGLEFRHVLAGKKSEDFINICFCQSQISNHVEKCEAYGLQSSTVMLEM